MSHDSSPGRRQMMKRQTKFWLENIKECTACRFSNLPCIAADRGQWISLTTHTSHIIFWLVPVKYWRFRQGLLLYTSKTHFNSRTLFLLSLPMIAQLLAAIFHQRSALYCLVPGSNCSDTLTSLQSGGLTTDHFVFCFLSQMSLFDLRRQFK